jgi:hypothetical protein
MSVTPADLQQPERGLQRSLKKRVLDESPAGQDDAAAELAALRARLEAARTIEPTDRERHCADCFHKGRNAAIRAIEG